MRIGRLRTFGLYGNRLLSVFPGQETGPFDATADTMAVPEENDFPRRKE
jgi:hypothetical protein